MKLFIEVKIECHIIFRIEQLVSFQQSIKLTIEYHIMQNV